MELTSDEKQQIEKLAGLWFEPKEIALILGIEKSEVLAAMKLQGEFFQCYQRGKLKSMVQLREAINKLAGHGSSPAQTLAVTLSKEQGTKEKMK